MNSNTFCVKLHCNLPSLLDGVIEKDYDLYMDPRGEVYEFPKSAVSDMNVLDEVELPRPGMHNKM